MWRKFSGPTTHQLLIAVLFAAIFAMAVRPPADTDTWWHLKSGQLMWERGEILRTDPFSHTVAGQPWIDHGWLVQVLLWPVYRVAGLGGLALLLAAIVTATFALVYRRCTGKPFLAAFAVLPAAIASSIIWSIRPQIVSLLLAAVVAHILDRYKSTGNARWLWLLPPLVTLWVNCHGGYVIAFLLMGCYLIGETFNRFTAPSPPDSPFRFRPLIIALLLSIPAVLLNPNTAKMIPYAYQTVSIGALQDFIQEWASPDFHNLQLHPFIWLLLLTLAALGLSRRRADWTDLALVGLFAYMSLLAVRNIALFALVVPPVLSRHAVAALDDLAQRPHLAWLRPLAHPRPPRRVRPAAARLNLVLLALLIAAAAAKTAVDLVRLRDPAVWGAGLPLEAAEFLRDHELPGQMFNTYNWGGYLIWSLYPEKPVFIDGRTDLYALNGTVLDDYVLVHWTRPGWEDVLDRYDIGYVITEKDGLLDVVLAETEGWRQVHRDSVASVWVREERP